MSLEKAFQIFTEQGFSDPQRVIEIIQKANSLDELKEIMIDERTNSSEDQFVSLQLKNLYKGDLELKQKTLEIARKKFKNYELPEEIINHYISEGGGIDSALSITFGISLGKFGRLNIDNIRNNLKEFYKDANQFLFNISRDYVINS